MHSLYDVWFDHIERTKVSEIENLCSNNEVLVSSYKTVYISLVDSSPASVINLNKIDALIGGRGKLSKTQTGLVTTGKVLYQLATSAHFFQGFDEVWFSNNADPAVELPKFLLIKSQDWIRELNVEATNKHLEQISSWMKLNYVDFGISDGDGLNYIATSESLALKIEST